MRVSVVVPARDAATTLGRCLDALAAQGTPGPAAELFVVDDASRDATATVAARPGVRVLTGSGSGPAAARNLGARAAAGPLLIFLDSDTAPLPGWLDADGGGALSGLSPSRRAVARFLLACALTAFTLTTLPLVRRAAGSDPALAATVPFLTYLRAWAQGLGILAGLVAYFWSSLRSAPAGRSRRRSERAPRF